MENMAVILTDQPKLSDEDRKLISLAYARVDSWKQECLEIHSRARESRKIMLLQDPRQDEPGAERKTLQLQTLKSTINNTDGGRDAAAELGYRDISLI